jgi:hypothetical protein
MVFTDPRRARNERTPSPQTELLNSAKSECLKYQNTKE